MSEQPTIRPPNHASIVTPVITRIEKARGPARSVLSAHSAMNQALIHVNLVQLANISLFLALKAAVPALAAPSLLPAKALAPSATRANILLLDPVLAKDAQLDTTQTSSAPKFALPALQAPSAQELAALVLPSAPLVLSKVSLLRPPALPAPRKQTLKSLELRNVLLVLPLLLSALLLVQCPVVECFSTASAPILSSE